MRRTVAIVFLGLVAGCSDGLQPVVKRDRRLVVPNGLAEIKLTQRSTKALPGSEGRVLLTIDDITRGQVVASISTDNGEPVLSPVSVREADSVRFTLDDRVYTLTLRRLHNELLGTDTAAFELADGDFESDRLTEHEKIERLIQRVAFTRDAVFVRNDKEYTCEEAASHMRDKWQWKADEIKTAEDFIRVAATRSSVTGKPYVIRFQDGREVETAEFLTKELTNIESAR